MNVLFFLTPKNEVAYISDSATLRQALEKMEHHGYTAVPIINSQGKYVGTLTDGDLLWAVKNDFDMNIKAAEEISVSEIKKRNRFNAAVNLNTNIEDLIQIVMNQNFVAVTTEDGIFMGIVTRKAIIDYFAKKALSCQI